MAKDNVKTQKDQSYGAIVKRQFNKNRPAVWSLRFVIVIIVIGLLADILSSDKPLYAKYQGNTYFPVFKEYAVDLGLSKWPVDLINANWKELQFESVIWTPIPYSAIETDRKNVHYVSPMGKQDVESSRWRHWLGTEETGRDVLAGLIHGTRIAMLVGVVSMSISAFIGILLGAFAGYYGDERLKASRIRLILCILFLPLAFFYAFSVNGFELADSFGAEGLTPLLLSLVKATGIFAGIMLVPNLLAMVLKKIPALGKQVSIPVDILISRVIEIIISIPSLLLIMSVVAIAKHPSIMLVMVIIGVTSWTGIARFIRGELLRVRNLEYIEASHALGYSEARTLFMHAIPNSLTPVLISIAFGVAGAILVESSLSFLGIGVQAEVVTWGKLLSVARNAPEAWWLAVFPGFAIFITVTVFNLIGEGLTDALDPRLKK